MSQTGKGWPVTPAKKLQPQPPKSQAGTAGLSKDSAFQEPVDLFINTLINRLREEQ